MGGLRSWWQPTLPCTRQGPPGLLEAAVLSPCSWVRSRWGPRAVSGAHGKLEPCCSFGSVLTHQPSTPSTTATGLNAQCTTWQDRATSVLAAWPPFVPEGLGGACVQARMRPWIWSGACAPATWSTPTTSTSPAGSTPWWSPGPHALPPKPLAENLLVVQNGRLD